MKGYKINAQVGKRIKKYRKELDITQAELGFKVGLDEVSISRIETGQTNPSVHTISKIARALKRKVKDLF